MAIEDFKERFSFSLDATGIDTNFSTVAGLLLAKFGAIPTPGQHCDIASMRFEVVDMDRQRIDKILVSRLG
jgi:putative hemolysin